jgi:protein-S-isoprenylcysteine O-methyltransferase Ste14
MQSKIMPPTYFLIAMVLSVVLHFVLPVKKVIFPPYTYSGGLFIIFGGVLNLWTDALFKEKKTRVKPYEDATELITQGPFKISRHPMYLGMTAVLVGIALLHGTIITFLFPIIFVIICEVFFIKFEEKSMERIFGQKYLDYKKKVRRWI